MATVNFFYSNVAFRVTQVRVIKNWIVSIVKSELFHVKQVNFIFCGDEYLLEINKQYLSHDDYTDIITFDYSSKKEIESDIFISIDRVWENCVSLNLSFSEELYRVMAHGILHLLGYNDKGKEEIETIRGKETFYISHLFHVKQNYKKGDTLV